MSDKSAKTLLKQTKLKDIMSKKVISIKVNALFSEIPKKLRTAGIRHLPVIDDSGKFVGLMTERELYKIHSPRKLMDGTWYYDEEMLNDIILKHVMIKDVFCLGPESSMGEALVYMANHKSGCIPIVDENHLLKGIITQYDFIKKAAQLYLEN